MPTEADITAQLADYFGWVEGEIGVIDAELPAAPKSPRRRRGLVAAAVLVAAAAGLTWSMTRSTPDSLQPGTTTAAQAEWQRSAGPPITKRFQHLSIATSGGWFVWGGYSAVNADPAGVPLFDGAYFDAAAGTWTQLPPAPFSEDHSYIGRGVWTGSEVLVTQGGVAPLAAAFNPTTVTWRSVPLSAEVLTAWPRADGLYEIGRQVMIGHSMAVVFERGSGTTVKASMLLLDTDTDTWSIAAAPPVAMQAGLVASSASQLFVIENRQSDSSGGCLGSTALHTYDMASDSWRSTTLPNGNWQPALAAWTGNRVLVAGGVICGSNEPTRTAATFDPVIGLWTDVADVPLDTGASVSGAIVVGDDVVVAMTTAGVPFAFDVETGEWWYGPSMLPSGETYLDDRLAMVVLDGRLSVASPGWNSLNGSGMCCDSTGEVFSLQLPAPGDFGLPPLPAPATTSPLVGNIPAGSCAYQVVTGDSLASIAESFDLTLGQLVAANPGKMQILPGDTLVIPGKSCKVQ